MSLVRREGFWIGGEGVPGNLYVFNGCRDEGESSPLSDAEYKVDSSLRIWRSISEGRGVQKTSLDRVSKERASSLTSLLAMTFTATVAPFNGGW